jgi:NAD(P)-dependent dehydrogenase (short-subunit alcohol dehydrogenase family)
MSPPEEDEGVLGGRVAVVSGVGSGLGRSTALALARQGASVALAARTESTLESVASEMEQIEGRSGGNGSTSPIQHRRQPWHRPRDRYRPGEGGRNHRAAATAAELRAGGVSRWR